MIEATDLFSIVDVPTPTGSPVQVVNPSWVRVATAGGTGVIAMPSPTFIPVSLVFDGLAVTISDTDGAAGTHPIAVNIAAGASLENPQALGSYVAGPGVVHIVVAGGSVTWQYMQAAAKWKITSFVH